MENLELQAQIISLGKLFVNELGLDPGVDTFSKWMAHYIAEKMTLAEQLPAGEDKEVAKKECFDTILKLWEHRWLLPSGKRPLREFGPILKTLERLNPEAQDPFFYRSLDYELNDLEKDNPDLKEITSCSKMALRIDKVARIWIDFVLHQAAMMAKNEKTVNLLKNTGSFQNSDDAISIKILLDNDPSINSENFNEENNVKKYQLEKLKRRIEELENFSKVNEFILVNYKKELEILS